MLKIKQRLSVLWPQRSFNPYYNMSKLKDFKAEKLSSQIILIFLFLRRIRREARYERGSMYI